MDEHRFYLLGPPHLERNDLTINIPRRKQWGLITYLLLTHQSHERDALAALFWPTYNQSHARANLRRELARLRNILPELFLNCPAAVALHAQAQLWVDVWEFQQHVAAVKAHSHAPDAYCAACLDHLRAARALYVDDLLAGFALRDSPGFEEWHFFQQESLRGQLLDVLSGLAQMEMAGGDLNRAIAPLRERLAIDPLHEESHRRLIWLYAHTGQRTAALRQFHECQDALTRDLGIAPAAETITLYRQIAQFAASPEENRAPPQRALHSAQADSTAPRFFGREQHMAQLETHLAAACDGHGRVVFVTGEAGTGKSALLSHFARHAMAGRSELIVIGGCGTTPHGADFSLLPFRDLFGMLAGDSECKWAAAMPSAEQVMRLRAFFPRFLHALVTLGPHLVDSLIAGDRLLARAAEAYLDNTEDYERLRALGAAHREQLIEPEAQHLIFGEAGAVLHALAVQRPLLLLVDDLQWADTLSFDLLFHLGKRVSTQAMLIVGAYRPSEIAPEGGARSHRDSLPTHHPLVALSHEFTREFGAVQVDLDAEALAQDLAWFDALLAAEACQLSPTSRNALFAQTHGHPLFSIELLQLWREQEWLRLNETGCWVEGETPDLRAVPVKAAAAIQRRIDRLRENAARLLTVASVAGEIFAVKALAVACGWNERRTTEILATELHHQHHLVAEVEDIGMAMPASYRFVNPLIRAYLYHQLDQGERRLIHAAFAQTMHPGEAGTADPVETA